MIGRFPVLLKALSHNLGILVLGLAILVSTDDLCASDTTQRLRTAVARLNDWLATGEETQQWRQFLDLNVLDAQVARGPQADRATLSQLLVKLESGHPSLSHPIFEEVRRSIRSHISQIDRSIVGDLATLQFAALDAVGRFRKPTREQIEYDRDAAIYELEMLRKAYRRDLDSRSRAGIFHQLQLKETVEMLKSLPVEMPPEVSVGKIRAMRNDEIRRRNEIIDRIDAIPLRPADVETEKADDENPRQLAPPEPDSGEEDDVESLEKKKKAIEERIAELTKKYNEILKVDRPRLIRVRDSVRSIKFAQARFQKMARKRFDSAFFSALQALDRVADSFQFGTNDNIQQEFIGKTTELANLIPMLAFPAERRAHAKLGNTILWLEQRKQLPDLCFSIRRQYSSPNAYVSVSSGLIQSLSSRSDNETDRVNEDFLGRIAKGWSYTNTSVSAVPVADSDQARVRIVLNGSASTDTYVRERSFRINSSASGYLSAQRDIFAGLNGLFASGTQASANMSSQYGGISTSIGLIQRIAAKSFAKEKGRTDQEASSRARKRLIDRFSTETDSVISDGVRQVETFSARLRKLDGLTPAIYLRSFF